MAFFHASFPIQEVGFIVLYLFDEEPQVAGQSSESHPLRRGSRQAPSLQRLAVSLASKGRRVWWVWEQDQRIGGFEDISLS